MYTLAEIIQNIAPYTFSNVSLELFNRVFWGTKLEVDFTASIEGIGEEYSDDFLENLCECWNSMGWAEAIPLDERPFSHLVYIQYMPGQGVSAVHETAYYPNRLFPTYDYIAPGKSYNTMDLMRAFRIPIEHQSNIEDALESAMLVDSYIGFTVRFEALDEVWAPYYYDEDYRLELSAEFDDEEDIDFPSQPAINPVQAFMTLLGLDLMEQADNAFDYESPSYW